MRRRMVAGGLVADERGLLLVANQRRNGSIDWSTPGGVVDPGETALDALTREVIEETGLTVHGWERLCWTVEVDFVDLKMHLAVEVHQATTFAGELVFDDPDGIVRDGAFLDPHSVRARLSTSPMWVAEPLTEWLDDPWNESRPFAYRVRGKRTSLMSAERRSA